MQPPQERKLKDEGEMLTFAPNTEDKITLHFEWLLTFYSFQVQRCVELVSRAKKPVVLLGSQATLPPTPADDVR